MKIRFINIGLFLLFVFGSAFHTVSAGDFSGLIEREVFVSGEDGYNTYRIPAIVITGKGTLLAFCEGRKISRLDHGFVHLVLKRSFDRGMTWEPMQVIHKDGWHTIGNPSPVVDRDTGTIWVPFCRDNRRVFVTRSEDDGATWSPPREITDRVKEPSWGWYATGPGHAIQLESGRLFIPCDHSEGAKTFSHVIYSDDHGASWKLGGTTGPGTNECMAVETADGRVYLTLRNLFGKKLRAYSWSEDGGMTWSKPKIEEALPCPVCQASIIRYTDDGRRDGNRILFLNPASTKRNSMTVKLSYDKCHTWPVSRELYDGKSAYSDMVILPDMTIGCLYERGVRRYCERITFTRMSLEWITGGREAINEQAGRNRED